MGLKNANGYNFDVAVTWENGKTEQHSPFLRDYATKFIVILPIKDEPAKKVQEWAKANNLIIIRDPSNNKKPHYQFLYEPFLTIAFLLERVVNTSEFKFYNDSNFGNGEWEISDSEVSLIAKGPNGSEQVFVLPKEYEVEW